MSERHQIMSLLFRLSLNNRQNESKIVSANHTERAVLLLVSNVIQLALRTFECLLPPLNNDIAVRASAAHWAAPLASVHVRQLGGIPSFVN